MIEELKRRARAGDRQALQELRDRGFFGTAQTPPRSYDVSAAQRRMWVLDQSTDVKSAYNLPRALRISGDLDHSALARALDAIVERHEALRTTFTTVDGEPRQIIQPARPATIEEADLRDAKNPAASAREIAREDAPRAFDLAAGPLFRVHLLRIADAEHVLLFNTHHIVCDAWSLENIVRELTALYRGQALPPLSRQYKDFAVWHNEWLRSAQADSDRRYWRRHLAAPLPVLDLPTDFARPDQGSWAGRTLTVDLGPSLTSRLNAFSTGERVTLFTTLMALTKSILYLESGQQDIIVGAPVAGRDHADVEPLIGMFANAVALRDRVTPQAPFRTLLRRVRTTVEDAFARQRIPFDEIVNDTGAVREAGRSPIFDVLVGLLNTDSSALELGGASISDFNTDTGLAPHDLVLYFAEAGGSLRLSILYRTDLFKDDSIRTLADRWQRVAARALSSPATRVSDLDHGSPAFAVSVPDSAVIGELTINLRDVAAQIIERAGAVDAVVIPGHDQDALDAFVVPGDSSRPDLVSARVLATGAPVRRVVSLSNIPLLADGRIHLRALERLAAAASQPAVLASPTPLHVWELAPRRSDSNAAHGIAAPSAVPAHLSTGGKTAIAAAPPLTHHSGVQTLADSLIKAASTASGTVRILRSAGGEIVWSYSDLTAEARRIATSLIEAGAHTGDPVLLLLPEQEDVLPAFWGAVFAGLVPLIASPPVDFSAPNRPLDQLGYLWSRLERPLIVTTPELATSVLSSSRLFDVTADRVTTIDALRLGTPIARPHQAQPDDVAFFSLTSGSTGNPKCVMLTHRNALSRARGMNQLCGCSSADTVLNWLPFDHIGSLSDWHLRTVDLGCSAIYAPPGRMLAEPLQWLATLDRYRATHSWAPNFAYTLVTDAVRGASAQSLVYDLSHVKMLLTAGEAVTPAAVGSFIDALAPFGLAPGAVRPAFGMAEMASGVTYGQGALQQPMRFHRIDRSTLGGTIQPASDVANAATYADLGPPIAGVSLRIVDDGGEVLPEWRIGRLQISGAPIAKGYYRDAEATRAAFLDDGWFDTGDYGFLADGCLALTGRAKDGIIVNGANYSSAEIEAAVEAVDGVTVTYVGAAAVRPGGSDEALAVFYVPLKKDSGAKLAIAIRQAVLEKIGLKVDYLVPLRREDIPKTAIGKIQRARLVSRFEAGDFDDIVTSLDLAVAADRTIPDWFSTKVWQPSLLRGSHPAGDALIVIGRNPTLADALSAHVASVLEVDHLVELCAILRPLAANPSEARTVLVATTGGQVVNATDDLVGDRASWAGLVVSLAQECPWLDLRIVDLDGDTVAANVQRCLGELSQAGGDRIAAWRGDHRYVPRLADAAVSLDPPGPSPIANGSLFLVTGGAGGAGRHVVAYLRDVFDARVLVVGRSAENLSFAGDAAVMYRSADTGDRAALDRAVDAAQAAFGRPLCGAFHLAGLASDRPVADETASSIEAAFKPKAVGALTLADLVRARCGAQGVFVTFSSVNGLLGGAGAAAYSAANAFVDVYTEHLRARAHLRCWNVAWSMWDETGMSRGFALRDATRAKGFTILKPDAAIRSLDAVLRREPAGVCIGIDALNPHVSPLSSRGTRVLGLPPPDANRERIAPRNETERRLARIWEDLLGVDAVGVDDQFVSLGGHSLKATQLVARIQKEFDTKVTLQDVFRAPTIAGLASIVGQGEHEAFTRIEPAAPAAHYPVSHAQRRLWVIDQMGLAGSAYHIEGATGLDGEIDVAALARAIAGVIARHESLRTTFAEIDGEPRQIVRASIDDAFAVVDLRDHDEAEGEARARMHTASSTRFDLTRGPLFRATLYRLSDSRSILAISMHHIVSDGWSMDIIIRELVGGYTRARRGDAAGLPPLRIHYKDFAAWQRQQLAAGENEHRAYWLEALAGELPVLDMPADHPRPAVQSFRGGLLEFAIPRATASRVLSFAATRGATPFMTWMTIVRLLIFKYTRAEDVILGTPVAGREHADLADQVGFYVNMLPLRIPTQASQDAAALLDRIKTIATGAIAHQLFPYDRLVEDLAIRRDAGRNPLFDVVVSVTSFAGAAAVTAGVETSSVALEAHTSKFDLTFFFNELADGAWQLSIEFNTDLFARDRIERMASHVATLAASVAETPQRKVSDLELLSPDEHRLLVDTFPVEPSAYPRERSVVSLFEEVASATPGAIAVLSPRGEVTYRDLNARANGLARDLIAGGVGREQSVGLLMAASEWSTVAMLGILKAGAAYVPLDPSHPAARRQAMLADANCRIVLSEDDVRRAVAIDDNAAVIRAAESLAYVMFTSGSTGRPKGSLIQDRAIVRLVRGANFAQVGPGDRTLLSGSLAFDASTFEIWGPLLNGGCVCLPGEREILDPESLASLISRWGVTTMWCTAGLFNQMVDADVEMFRGLTRMLTGGERLSPSHVRRFQQALPHVRLINGYGPTENTTFTACHVISDADTGEIPLGRPISNTSILVLDADLNPAPVGVDGEIFAGGDGLARGYVNDPQLTAERFIPHPFQPGGRLYRTGDAGRWRSDGVLEFRGRIDAQLKIRGYRVEPGEIETAIRQQPGIDDVAVVARLTGVGTTELVAFIVSPEQLAPATLRTQLAATLPDYMVPQHWVQLDRLPLNASHKVDRRALPIPAATGNAPASETASSTSIQEQVLIELCGELLGSTPGAGDNYFEFGGDSIRAIQLASRLRRKGWRLQVKDVFTYPTIAALAGRLTLLDASPASHARQDTPGPVPMTAAQRWFFAHHQGPLGHFNQAVLLAPSIAIEETPLRAVMDAIVEQHDALRLTFPIRDGQREAQISPKSASAWLETIDLRETGAPDLGVTLDELHGQFQIEHGPLFRAVLVETTAGQRLWLAAHHLVVDGVSWRVLLEQLAIGYEQSATGRVIGLGEPSASFRDRAEESATFASGVARVEAISASQPEETPVSTYGGTVTVAAQLSADDTRALLSSVHHAYGTEINDLLLAALGAALGDWSGSASTVIDLEGHGRERLLHDLDLTRTVGWFTSIYPVRLSAEADYRNTIRATKERLRAIPRRGVDHGIAQYLNAATPPATLPSISFNYLGQFDASGTDALFAFAPESSGAAISPDLTRAHALDVVSIVTGDELNVSILADERAGDSAQRLIDLFTTHLRSLVAHCVDRVAEKTPSDCTLSLPLADYDALVDSRGWRHEDIADICAAAPMQEGLLLLSIIDPESTAYHVQMAYTISGELEPARFESAWQAVVRTHPVLRSAFAHRGLDRPIRVAMRERLVPFAWHDLRDLDPGEQTLRIQDARDRDLQRGFDFEREPLMRFAVFRLSADRWHIVWSYHHVLLDGWSLGLVMRDFAAAYAAPDADRASAIAGAPDPALFSAWLARQDAAAARAFWANYLDGYDQAAGLPPHSSHDAARKEAGEHRVSLSPAETTALGAVATQWGVTTATLLMTAWGVVLARYNRADDVVFGSIVSGRPSDLADADRLVGAFINAVPVRVRSSAATLRELASTLQGELAAAERFHHVPLAEIQECSPLGRDLFSHMMIIENYPVEQQLADAGRTARLTVERLEAHDRTHYDFSITVNPGESLAVSFQYDPARLDREQVERTAGHFLRVLRAFGTIDAVADVEIMSDAERELVVRGYQPVRRSFAPGTVVELLEQQAAQSPQRPAVVASGLPVSYGALADSARRLSRVLADAGAGAGDRVGVMLERSASVPAALFGVLRAGAAYVPLDPDYPIARLELMIADSACALIVTSERSLATLPMTQEWTRIAQVDDLIVIASALSHPRTLAPSHPRGPDLETPAYVMYTSGSTGTPKGVVIPHRALASQAQWFAAEFALTGDDRFFQKAPISFDASIEEIFAPLIAGGTVVIPGEDEHLDPERMTAALIRDGVTLLQLVPSQFAAMLDAGWNPSATALRILFLGSEALDVQLLARLPSDRRFEVVNLYGPTETCDNAATWRWDGRTTGSIPIGVPVANTKAYVTDARLAPLPPGVFGEICLAGDNLAIGYHNRPDLTAERFVTAPALGERVYRTGDLGRWVDGVLEYGGRIDQQVKIRGHRIECGEIEAQLRAHPAVQDCAVVVGRILNQPQLVAFCVNRSGTSSADAELRQWLAARLLDAMIPSRFVILEELPAMPNGKIDRRGLQQRASALMPDGDNAGTAPRNARESAIADIWSAVLGVHNPDVRLNFFEAGGHSLKAMQIVSRMHRDLGVRLSLRDLFRQPTIEGLASLANPDDKYSTIEPAPPQDTYALSHAQQRLWLLHHLPGGDAAYNMPSAFSIEGTALNLPAIDRAFTVLVERHEALRTAFVVVDGETRQRILPHVPMAMTTIDLREAIDADAQARLLAEQDAVRPFDLTSPPLLRVTAIAMPGTTPRTIVLLTIHHIVGDGWSGEVLIREIATLYDAFSNGRDNPLLPLRIQYKDFSEWQNRKAFADEERWWVESLDGAPERIALPADFTATDNRQFLGAIEEVVLDPSTTAALAALGASRGMTLSHTMLALFMLTLNRLTGQDDLCVGMSVANRNHADLEGLIGFFVNVLPVRVRITPGMELGELLDSVSTVATDALDRQDYPFDLLVRRLNPQRAATRQPLVNVIYAFQNFTDVRLGDSEAAGNTPDSTTVNPFDFEFRTSKFDLTLFVSNEQDSLRLILEYDTGLFAPATAQRVLSVLGRFARMASSPAEAAR